MLLNAKEPTCAKEGYSGDLYCIDCKQIIIAGNTIEKSDLHSWDEGIITKQPTYTETGIRVFTCDICEGTKTRVVAVLIKTENDDSASDLDNTTNDTIVNQPSDSTQENSNTQAQNPTKKQIIKTSVANVAYKKNKKVSLKATTDGGGKLIYESSNKKVATVSAKGVLTIKGYGKTTITITATANGEYIQTTKKFTVTVGPKKVTLSKVSSPSKKTVSAKWKKSSDASGYQIQISLNKNFKKNTIARNYGKSKSSIKLRGLNSKK